MEVSLDPSLRAEELKLVLQNDMDTNTRVRLEYELILNFRKIGESGNLSQEDKDLLKKLEQKNQELLSPALQDLGYDYIPSPERPKSENRSRMRHRSRGR